MITRVSSRLASSARFRAASLALCSAWLGLGACLALPGANERESAAASPADTTPAPDDAAPREIVQPSHVECFDGVSTLVEATSRLSLDHVVAHDAGWVSFSHGANSWGAQADFVGADGRVLETQPGIAGGRLIRVGTAYIVWAPQFVQRIDFVEGVFVSRPALNVDWGGSNHIIAVAPLAADLVRVLKRNDYDAQGNPLPFSLHVYDLHFDDNALYGFSVEDRPLPADLTALIDPVVEAHQYAFAGDTMRVVSRSAGPGDKWRWRTQLFRLGLGVPVDGVPLGWELLEQASWESSWAEGIFAYNVAAIMPDGERLLVVDRTTEPYGGVARVEALPGHASPTPVVGALGQGDPSGPRIIDGRVIAVPDGEILRLYDAVDLTVLGQLDLRGQFAGAALNGDRLGVFSFKNTATKPTLELQCVAVPSRVAPP